MDKLNPVKKDPLILIGEKLKIAREGRSLDIEQVQKQTHINSRVIVALEEGRCDDILTPTYVKAFLKKYSQFLGLDCRDILKEYSSMHSDEAFSHLNTGTGEFSYPGLRRIVYIALFLLAAALVIFGITWMGRAVKKSIAAKKVTRARPVLAVSPKKQAGPPAAVKKGPFTLVIKTKKQVLIKARKDGEPLFSRVFLKGSSETIKAGEKVDLYITEAESVELVLNGRSIGSPGKGTVKDVEVTSEGVRLK